MDGLTDGLGYS